MNNLNTLPAAEQPICALATGTGGAIAIIRTSGGGVIDIVDKIFRPAGGVPLSETPNQTLRFGPIEDGEGKSLDEALVAVFRAPHSYTGEDSVELSLHASSYIIHETLNRLCELGCRIAEPGEFTKRAFLNGKLDLSQAEAVADLIASSSRVAHDVAFSQMRGNFSTELQQLCSNLQELSALLELELDFDEYETMEFANRSTLISLINQTIARIAQLIKSYDIGAMLKQGIPVAIVGKTNVGKSTLLNRLLREERAIVSNTHGTTRDTIEDTIDIHGVTFRFIDTAGIRHTNDEVERIGIQRTMNAIERARIVLYVYDEEPSAQDFDEIRSKAKGAEILYIRNKIDLQPLPAENCANPNAAEEAQVGSLQHPLRISAKTDEDIASVEEAIYKAVHLSEISENEIIVTSARHRDALIRTRESLQRVSQSLQANVTADLIAEDLRLAIAQLSEITGRSITPETTLQHIFSHFCVGK
ncbi:MAG: tRNA uridine-5-carboxymethylaminomethyl(34) synthesis GTPase MnmE [Bacteroidaceae bacterium]|nr:tRNA uridine-5-carboxymethylaminomethyl(34) synthesis GTPase MnmE [Bacteroidaceae bacterium]